jgi:hypothetical protein
MARYHFHMKSKQIEIQDEIGKIFGSACEAYIRAQEIIRQCLRHLALDDDDEQWMINVCNESDDTELIVLFPRRQAFN